MLSVWRCCWSGLIGCLNGLWNVWDLVVWMCCSVCFWYVLVFCCVIIVCVLDCDVIIGKWNKLLFVFLVCGMKICNGSWVILFLCSWIVGGWCDCYCVGCCFVWLCYLFCCFCCVCICCCWMNCCILFIVMWLVCFVLILLKCFDMKLSLLFCVCVFVMVVLLFSMVLVLSCVLMCCCVCCCNVVLVDGNIGVVCVVGKNGLLILCLLCGSFIGVIVCGGNV